MEARGTMHDVTLAQIERQHRPVRWFTLPLIWLLPAILFHWGRVHALCVGVTLVCTTCKQPHPCATLVEERELAAHPFQPRLF